MALNGIVVFLDKDGTLVKDVPYNVDPQRVTLENGAAAGLMRLAQAGCAFVIVSNQSGVARGYFTEDHLADVEAHLRKLVQEASGVSLEGFYYCPHHPDGSVTPYAVECECRKPKPGMLLRAAQDLGINLSQTWMVGDILNDVEAGNRAGCRTILIANGNETEWETGPYRIPFAVAADLEVAAEIIISTVSAEQEQPSRKSEPFGGRTWIGDLNER